ncbi:unnamed protein product [Acanthoscelides obtectus]|uniref:Uncharacterized protein n=1 Tax=Acanthoscelides obtectus TaxID=200917 RepID=A0A9P0KWG4_ACAOB|nr:unnamed protein product [Acanthoscelides obtectus]CAK1676853.1 hypothetical protein AOBTE_LOCUS30972 [Acanthoscelides obtectus]
MKKKEGKRRRRRFSCWSPVHLDGSLKRVSSLETGPADLRLMMDVPGVDKDRERGLANQTKTNIRCSPGRKNPRSIGIFGESVLWSGFVTPPFIIKVFEFQTAFQHVWGHRNRTFIENIIAKAIEDLLKVGKDKDEYIKKLQRSTTDIKNDVTDAGKEDENKKRELLIFGEEIYMCKLKKMRARQIITVFQISFARAMKTEHPALKTLEYKKSYTPLCNIITVRRKSKKDNDDMYQR